LILESVERRVVHADFKGGIITSNAGALLFWDSSIGAWV
jgi:hypothetical protein